MENRLCWSLKKTLAALLLVGALSFASTARAQITMTIVYDSLTDVTTFTYSGTMGVSSDGAKFPGAVPHIDSGGFAATDYPIDTSYASISFSTFDWPVANATFLTPSGDFFGFENSTSTVQPNTVWGPASFMTGTSISGSSTVTQDFDYLGFTSGSSGSIVGAGGAFVVNWTATASAIPEPSTYAAFAGLAVMGMALWRRRATA